MTENPSALTMAEPYHKMRDPLEMDDARDAARAAAAQRREAARWYDECIERSAEAIKAYRKGYAAAFVSQREGSVTQRELQARADAADLEYEMTLAAGMVKAAEHRLRALEGERAMLRLLIEQSGRILGYS